LNTFENVHLKCTTPFQISKYANAWWHSGKGSVLNKSSALEPIADADLPDGNANADIIALNAEVT